MNKITITTNEKVKASLSYFLGLIIAFIFYSTEKNNKFIRFHSAQAILISYFMLAIIILTIPIALYFTAQCTTETCLTNVERLLSFSKFFLTILGLTSFVCGALILSGRNFSLWIIGNIAKKKI